MERSGLQKCGIPRGPAQHESGRNQHVLPVQQSTRAPVCSPHDPTRDTGRKIAWGGESVQVCASHGCFVCPPVRDIERVDTEALWQRLCWTTLGREVYRMIERSALGLGESWKGHGSLSKTKFNQGGHGEQCCRTNAKVDFDPASYMKTKSSVIKLLYEKHPLC